MPANKDDDVLELDHEQVEDDEEQDMAQDTGKLAEEGNLAVAMTAMANEFGAAAARRVNSADQLASDSQRMWTIHMTTPSTNAALGFRTATESGSGRTRVEANTPVAAQTQGG